MGRRFRRANPITKIATQLDGVWSIVDHNTFDWVDQPSTKTQILKAPKPIRLIQDRYSTPEIFVTEIMGGEFVRFDKVSRQYSRTKENTL